MKSLIVNADDFGFTRDVNEGIVQAHRDGILTATTLMATGAAFDDAARLAKETPSLDIGCHLVLVGAPPFPATVGQLIRAVALRRIHIYEELVSQVRRILDAGITPSHLDTHKHTHLLPPVLDAVTRISGEFKIPWVRKPFDFRAQPGGVGWKNRLMQLRRPGFERAFVGRGCRSTDWFTGFRITGNYNSTSLAELIRALPDGSTEMMCHPGILGPELQRAGTRLKQSRQDELTALTSSEVREAIQQASVELTCYRALH